MKSKRFPVGSLLVLLSWLTASANDLKISNVRFVATRDSNTEFRVLFDISWNNAWNNSKNHDAAWVFVKFMGEDGAIHAVLAPDGHKIVSQPGRNMPEARIDLPQDRMGAFVIASSSFRGDVQWTLSLRIDTSRIRRQLREAQVEVFAIEMVYIPSGKFTLGDPGTQALEYGAFYRSDNSGEPSGLVEIASENELQVGPTDGALFYREGTYSGDRKGPVPATFPKGYNSFYCMKYEITQGEYADFLNTLGDAATFNRVNFMGKSYYKKRGTIRLDGDTYVAGSPNRPMNFLSWDDGLAYADWAGLRPLTELEFTKAARGPKKPVANEFPWGTSSRDQLARIVDANDDLVLTNGWTEAQLTEETRPVFGASYYWVMDLAGSVWERVITIGSPDGRSFTGSHGDGTLDHSGDATNVDWPLTYKGRNGHGYRGGGFYDQGRAEHEFNPYSPVTYRRFGAWSGADPVKAYGFRCGRTEK